MKIGIDIRPLMSAERTGVGEYTYEFLDALFKLDRENQYFLFYNSGKDVSDNIPEWDQDNISFVGTKYPNKLFNLILLLFKYPKLDKLVSRKTGIEKLDYWFSTNLNFSALSRDVKYILTVHDLSFEYFTGCFSVKRRFWHKLVFPKKQCSSADIILTPSENTKNDLVETYNTDKEKVYALYPGLSSVFVRADNVDIEKVRRKYNLPEKFILFLGTIEPRKNILGILKAFENKGFASDGFELVVAGSDGWKNNDIKDCIKRTQGVRYIGYVDSNDKPAICGMANIFVYPSLYEGFGFPVLEAMSSGTPVITSNGSSLSEVVGNSGYLVNPNNIAEISEAMERILRDNKLSNYFVQKAQEKSEQFRWEKTVNKFLELLKK